MVIFLCCAGMLGPTVLLQPLCCLLHFVPHISPPTVGALCNLALLLPKMPLHFIGVATKILLECMEEKSISQAV